MNRHHIVEDVSIEGGTLRLAVNGLTISKNIRGLSSSFARATEEELAQFEVTPSGYGIHWPLLDEDLSIDGLMGIVHAIDAVPDHRSASLNTGSSDAKKKPGFRLSSE